MATSPNDIIKAVAEFVLTDGTIAQNVFHYRQVGVDDLDDGDVTAAIAASLNNLYDDIAPYITDDLIVNPYLFNIVGFNLELGKWVTERTLGYEDNDLVGTGTQDAFPNQVAAVLTGATLVPKRRGRKFFPAFVETSAIAGELIGAAQTALAAAGVDWLVGLPMGGGNYLNPVVLATAAANADGIVSCEVNSILGTQRRRKPGVGR